MRIRATLATILVGLAVVASGCGSASIEGVAEAASQTASAESVHFTMTMSQSLPGGQAFAVTARGAFDGPGRKLGMSMDMSGLGTLFATRGVPTGELQMDAVMDGVVMYFRMPVLDRMLPAGKRWVRVDLARLGQTAGLDLQSLMGGAANDPRRTLESLRSASDLERSGEETVRGVATTRYRGTIDLRQALDDLPADQRQAARAALGTLEGAGLDSVPTQVWVDRDGFVRRVRQTYALEIGRVSSATSVEMDFFGFGKPVDVTVPPAGETIDVTSLGG